MRKKVRDSKAKKVLREIYDYIKVNAVDNQSLKVIDKGVQGIIQRSGVKSSTIPYMGFGSAVSWGVNDRMAHMPSNNYSLRPGDLVSADVVIEVGGYHYDSCRSFLVPGVGKHMEEKLELIKISKQARDLGISMAKPGTSLRAIRVAVNRFVTSKGYHVVACVGGHGIYDKIHHEPLILFGATPGQYDKYKLKEGDRITIEPIVSQKLQLPEVDKYDGWTLYLDEDNLSAYWEETIEVTSDKPNIVTETYDTFTTERGNDD